MQKFHVHSIEDRPYWQGVASHATYARLTQDQEPLAKIADRPALPSATDYLAAKRSNNRGILDHHWHFERRDITRLVLNRLHEGMAADDRLLNWIFDLLHEPTWVVSAHLPGHDLPLSGAGQLDLAACEMAAELAELREGLLPWLKQQSGTLDQSIVNEIDRRCLKPFLEQKAPWWADPKEQINNWSGVCGGALLNACLSLEAQGFARPDAARKSVDALRMFFNRAFTATGECDEGPSYWLYGVSYAVMPLMRLSREQIAQWFDVDRIKCVARYLERCHIAGGRFYAANDCIPNPRAAVGTMTWLAEFADSDFLRWWVVNYTAQMGRGLCGALRDLDGLGRLSDWANVRAPVDRCARLLPDQQAGIFQRQTRHGLCTFILSGGHNGESHNHNDLGAIQLLIDETPWILDPGTPYYSTDFFGPKRYEKYIVAASSGHCCPAINGHEQYASHEACGRIVDADVESGRLTLDLTRAYRPEAGVHSWQRSVQVAENALEAAMLDEIELAADGEVIHRLWLRERPTVSEKEISCGPVRIAVSPSANQVDIEEFLAGDERLNLREFAPETKLYRVSLRYGVKAGEKSCVTWRISLA